MKKLLLISTLLLNSYLLPSQHDITKTHEVSRPTANELLSLEILNRIHILHNNLHPILDPIIRERRGRRYYGATSTTTSEEYQAVADPLRIIEQRFHEFDNNRKTEIARLWRSHEIHFTPERNKLLATIATNQEEIKNLCRINANAHELVSRQTIENEELNARNDALLADRTRIIEMLTKPKHQKRLPSPSDLSL